MTTRSDLELLDSIRTGDGKALGELYERYVSNAYSLALKITRDKSLAQEVIQDVFTKVWVSPQLYQPERGRFSSWLLTITRNTAIDALRKQSRNSRFSVVPPLILHELTHETPNLLSRLEHEEIASTLNNSMSELKSEQLELLQLTYWQGYTLSEVATMKNLPIGTVKSRLHSTLKMLRGQLQSVFQFGKEER